ncbi:MAG: dockerin type I domain-containing protein [Candidatus Bipolaricaulaceae bacterium]
MWWTTRTAWLGFLLLSAICALALGQDQPAVNTLSPADVSATSATLLAEVSVGDYGWTYIQLVGNPDFEEPGEDGAEPSVWAGPVLLAGEDDPSTAALHQREGYDAPGGEFAGYLKYGTAGTPGWAGVAYGQSVDGAEDLDPATPLQLSYWVRPQYAYGTSSTRARGGLIEVEIVGDGTPRRLRYVHLRVGDPPPDSADVKYIPGRGPDWQTWTDCQHQLSDDVARLFPELAAFSVTAVRVGLLVDKVESGECRIYWLFDGVELHQGRPGISVHFEYRRKGDPTWQTTSPTAFSADGTHQATVSGLAPNATYEFRAALTYAEGTVQGAIREFTTRRYPGDVDGNGIVDLADLRRLLRAALGLISLPEPARSAADYDADGDIDRADAESLARRLIGTE